MHFITCPESLHCIICNDDCSCRELREDKDRRRGSGSFLAGEEGSRQGTVDTADKGTSWEVVGNRNRVASSSALVVGRREASWEMDIDNIR